MDFIDSVKEQIKDLENQENELRQKIAPVLREIDSIKAQKAHLEAYLTATSQDSRGEDTEKRESITEKIIRVFERAKRPLHYMEILDLLEKQEGFLMTGKDPKANLTAKLAGSPRFKRTSERGVYLLSDWLPDKNAPKKQGVQ